MTRWIATIGTTCLLFCVLGHGRSASAIDVLVAAADSIGDYDVVQELDFTYLFTTVDLLDVSTTTPTLGDLLAYEAVMVYRSGQFDDPELFGDNLADYLDSGGGLVFAHWATMIPDDIAGRLRQDGYLPYEAGMGVLTMDDYLTLEADDPGHAILAGVNAFHLPGSDRDSL